MAFKLFPKQKKIPTIVGIFILILGIATTTYLSQRIQQFFLKAEPGDAPQNVKMSNLTSTTFTISWLTPDLASAGYLKYGKTTALGKIGLDDRDQKLDTAGKFNVHHITITDLEPQTTYYFKIVSGAKEYDQNGNPYSATTLSANYPLATLSPTFGTILEENGQAASEGIVYVKIGSSAPVSTLIKSSGNWLASLSNLANLDPKKSLEIQPDDKEEIFVQGRNKSAEATTSLKNNTPVPPITLGGNYNFLVSASPTPTKPTVPPSTSANFNLTQPASDAAIPGQPLFRGSGVPGKTVKIEVHSDSTFLGETTVDSNGNWVWQVPANLSVGEHSVSVTSVDSQGNPQTIIRKFLVLASGSMVTEAATPSATPTSSPSLSPTRAPTLSPTKAPTSSPTPTLSPTPTPSLTLTPAPTAATTPPESGDLLLTLILGGSGLFFISLGFIFLKPRTI